MNEKVFDESIYNAIKYNKELYEFKTNAKLNEKKEELVFKYNLLLNLNDDGMMGYIKIPKIGVEIPIYHGTSNKALQKGVGHFDNSSLPVGGRGSHAVLSGHRGLATSRLFTDLDQLETDDMFYVYVSNKTLAYKIDQIKVVKPSEIDFLKIEKDKDYITLVTCTPYAINTHRLLVRGTRVEMDEKKFNNIKKDKTLSTADLVLVISSIVVIIMLIMVMIFIYKINNRKKL